jgi:hypothetical protein
VHSPLLLSALGLLIHHTSAADFSIINPNKNAQWVNGQANLVTWAKGLRDDVIDFDIELMRLSGDGFIYVARGGAHIDFYHQL